MNLDFEIKPITYVETYRVSSVQYCTLTSFLWVRITRFFSVRGLSSRNVPIRNNEQRNDLPSDRDAYSHPSSCYNLCVLSVFCSCNTMLRYWHVTIRIWHLLRMLPYTAVMTSWSASSITVSKSYSKIYLRSFSRFSLSDAFAAVNKLLVCKIWCNKSPWLQSHCFVIGR